MGNETEDRSREEEQVTAASSTDNSGTTDTTDNNTSSVQPLQQTEEDTNTGSQEGAHVTGTSQTPARELEQVSNQMGINAVAAGGLAPTDSRTEVGTPAPGNSVEDSAPAPTSSRTEGETSTPGNSVEDSAPAPTGSRTEGGTSTPGNSVENEREPAPSGDTNDEENDHEDTETNNTGAPQNPQRTPQQPPGENLTEVLDNVRGDVSDLAANTSSGIQREGNGGEDSGAFHTMKELLDAQKKGAGEEKPSAGGAQGGENKSEFEKLYDAIKIFRNGGFYKAVILAKSLEKGGGNPLRGERKRDKARRGIGGFFNSSKFDKTSDVMKLAGASTGALGAFDAKFKGSFVAQGISLVSNFMAFVTSFRGFINKIKQHRKLPKKSDKVFNFFGIITDGVTLLAKGAAIAKTIAGFAGKVNSEGTGVFGTIWDRVTLLLNSISQIGGLMGVSRGLHKGRENLTKMKDLEKGERKKVIDIVRKYNGPGTEPEQDTDANQEGSSAPGEPATVEGKGLHQEGLSRQRQQATRQIQEIAGKRRSVKQMAREAKVNRSQRKEMQKQASVLLYDARVSEEDKDQLAAYLALNRRIKNLRKGQASMAMGLLATLTAFGSSIAASVNNHNDEEKKSIKQAAAYMGVAASGMGIVATATGMGISDRHAKKMDTQETDTIQERLWHVIESVKSDDKYGLKKVEAEMDVLKAAKENNTPLGAEAEGEIMTHAQTAKDKYASASGQFAAAGVNYKALFSVKDLREFKQGLISGI